MPRETNTSTERMGRKRSNHHPEKSSPPSDHILLLHGNRQTGQLLLGRLDKLRKRVLKEFRIGFLAPDAPFPHPEDSNLRTWWNRKNNDYRGLEETLRTLLVDAADRDVVGIMGFSQGARLVHLLANLHSAQPKKWFPRLNFVILVAGYDAPIPDRFPLQENPTINVPSLHVWGLADPLISPDRSESVLQYYESPHTHIHEGKHYVPSKAPDLKVFMEFIQQSIDERRDDLSPATNVSQVTIATPPPQNQNDKSTARTASTLPLPLIPDEDCALMQQDEVEALEAIFPEEVILKSLMREVDGERLYEHPIVYEVMVLPTDPGDTDGTNWPALPLKLRVSYPHNYPIDVFPKFKLVHENNITQFPRCRLERFTAKLYETAEMELGMPSVLSCLYAVREYLDSALDDTDVGNSVAEKIVTMGEQPPPETKVDEVETDGQCRIKRSSEDQIATCTREGLKIAETVLRNSRSLSNSETDGTTGKGGSFWTYTIGLVGKPSAGKSTFFNAATAFSRQRCEKEGDHEMGGASMAAHPFTTIDPNIGYCLVPAPEGSCPEDGISGSNSGYGSTHGRDPHGRRFLPVLLKDVAGLVPGAYQGRGRGNQFLNDLCDATVLIHVVDASGTADEKGNTTVAVDGDGDFSDPLHDLAWIRNELVEWVYSNLMQKWSSVIRKGEAKLSGMFSGYGQNQKMTNDIFVALDKYLEEKYDRDRALDNIALWDQGDVHRVVSAFLGVRFPMALALNKLDLPSSKKNVDNIQQALPIHGAHVATPLAARSEMTFVRNRLATRASDKLEGREQAPFGVWQCLGSAIMLREPVLVFPVADMTTYAPLPGMHKNAVGNPSLPSEGMVRCIQAAGGSPPSCWRSDAYVLPSREAAAKTKLRDVIMMKPGSTVDDVFQSLKKYGALGGVFVRAEGAGNVGEKAKLVPKHAVMGRENRIIKIMSSKRTTWQSSMPRANLLHLENGC